MLARRPPAIAPGSRIALVAPAGALPPPGEGEGGSGLPGRLRQGMERLRQMGYDPVLFPHATARHGYLAGSDRVRAADLMAAFADPEVDAVFCVRGGYGSTRILPLLDYDLIAQHPKVFVGFSDITALHAAFNRRAGLVTFHGPVPDGGYARDENLDNLLTLVTGQGCRAGWEGSPTLPLPEGWQVDTLVAGTAEGRLVGGNLSLLCALVGTPYEPDTRDSVLVLEDVGEPPYRLDRMLTHLLQAGRLSRVKGIVVGELVRCAPPPGRPSLEAHQVVADRLVPLGVPCVANYPCGHGPRQLTLPLGCRVRLDSKAGSLTLLEPPVDA